MKIRWQNACYRNSPVTGVPKKGSLMQQQDEDSEFKYTQQYFDYHRNMLLFFSACIIITWAGLELDVEKIAYLTGDKKFINHWLPWTLFGVGCYHAVLFIPEWRACARPHWKKVKSANAQIESRLDSLRGASESLATTYKVHLEALSGQWFQNQLDRISAMMQETRRQFLKNFEEETRPIIENFYNETQSFYAIMDIGSSGYDDGPAKNVKEALDDIKKLQERCTQKS